MQQCHVPIGLCFVALWNDAVCQLAFVDSLHQEQEYLGHLVKQRQISKYEKKMQKINEVAESWFHTSHFEWQGLVQGSPFDKKVWQALLQIPYGETLSYLELSQMLDLSNPKNFARAVGGAVGRNLLGYLVPCHRVVYHDRKVGNYRYGSHHKQKLLAWGETESLKTQRIVAVDLDGTLIQGDLFFQSFCILIKRNPFYLLLITIWFLKGRPFVKFAIAQSVQLDPSTLSYNDAVLQYLKECKNNGDYLILATGTTQHYAMKIADYLQLFDEVWGTYDKNNTGDYKCSQLVKKFGKQGFDYIGNSYVDLKIWKDAKHALIVSSNPRLIKKLQNICPIIRIFK